MAYENILFAQGEDADEFMRILDEVGEEACLDYMTQWHNPGRHELLDDNPSVAGDYTYESDGYVMSWNPHLPYIGLVYKGD